MAVSAAITFAQGIFTGAAGEAFEGTVAGGSVTVTNDDNSNVTSWTITLLDVPPDSSQGVGILDSQANNTPTANFSPDAPGSYRILLEVTDGTNVARDIRNFGIRNARGIILPSYQKLPDPLPLVGSGLPGQQPDEQNYSGNVRGWAGNRIDGNLEQFYLTYDDLPIKTVSTSPFTPTGTNQEEPVFHVTVGGSPVFNLPSGVRVGQRFRIIASGNTMTVNPPGGHTISGQTSVKMYPGASGVFVYKGGTVWLALGIKWAVSENTVVAGTQDTDQTGFQTIGATFIDMNGYINVAGQEWQVVLETTNAADAAEIRLFNVTTSSVVADSTLSTTSLTPVILTTDVTLASGLNLYEAQLRLQTTGTPNRATCKQARIVLSWFQP